MRVEGQARIPDFLDVGGVLHTVHRKKKPGMSPEEYTSGVSPYNTNEGNRVSLHTNVDVIAPRGDLSNVSIEAIERGDYNQPVLVGRLDSELEVF